VSSAPQDHEADGWLQRTTAKLDERFGRYEQLPLVDFGLGVYRRDREIVGTVAGSAIAFRLFLFFVPLLLFIVGVAGFVARWLDAEDVNEDAGLTGSLAAQIDTALSQPNQTRWVAVLVGLVGVATAGYSLSKVMVAVSALGWRLPERPKAKPKVIGAIVGLIAGVGLIALIINRIRADLGLGAVSLSFVAAFAFYFVAWFIISMMLPRATRDPGALLPGATLVALTITGMQAISQLYIPDRLSRASELYGTFGATIVTLGWFFFLGRAIVLGIVINAVVFERFGRIANFVFSWPLLRLLRRSRLIRRVFRLEDHDSVVPERSGGG
jgi:membrane protein